MIPFLFPASLTHSDDDQNFPKYLSSFPRCFLFPFRSTPQWYPIGVTVFGRISLFVLSLAVLCAIQLKLHVCEDALTRKGITSKSHLTSSSITFFDIISKFHYSSLNTFTRIKRSHVIILENDRCQSTIYEVRTKYNEALLNGRIKYNGNVDTIRVAFFSR